MIMPRWRRPPGALGSTPAWSSPVTTAWTDLLAAYSDEQLALLLDLFDRLHQMSLRQLASLDHDTPSSDTATS